MSTLTLILGLNPNPGPNKGPDEKETTYVSYCKQFIINNKLLKWLGMFQVVHVKSISSPTPYLIISNIYLVLIASLTSPIHMKNSTT